MRLCALVLLLAGEAAAGECPPPPDHRAALDGLFDRITTAPTEAEARALNDRMWTLWTDAPDAHARDLLDSGMARRELHDFAAAQAAFDALVAYCPDWAEGYNQRAFIAFLRGDYTAALADLDRALARAPRHLGALSGKALSLIALGRVEAGHSVLRHALTLNPWLPERHLLPPPPPGTDL